MVQTDTPGLAANPGLIARMGPPAGPHGFLAWAFARLRMWQESFAEAQEMRRESSERHPFFDS